LNRRLASQWLTAISTLTASSVFTQSPGAQREQLVHRVLQQLHHEAYDSALTACAMIRHQWPDDPTADVLQTSVYQTQMRNFRVRLREAEFDSLSKNAVKLAEKKIKEHPTAEMFYMQGSARGLQALYRFQQGEWSAALRDAAVALHVMNRALQKDESFVDPRLMIGLYKYWKSQKLGFGVDLYAHERQEAFVIIEQVWKQGRYSSVEAALTLQNVLLYSREIQKALEVNDWLHERYPAHPSVLYHRALLMERLQRPAEALALWEKLIQRIKTSPWPSHTFLAECYLHCAHLGEALRLAQASGNHAPQKISEALQLAAWHAERRNKTIELESIFQKFDDVEAEIKKMQKDRASNVSGY
jgi:tetratricopeptide (TPR) repeat protein